MLAEFFDTVTQIVRGWWVALAEAPWSSLGLAILLALLLPALGYLAGWLIGRRRKTVAAGSPEAARALSAAQSERDRQRTAAEKAAAEVEGLTRRLREAEAARDAALSARREADTLGADARRLVDDAGTARDDAERAATETAAALRAAEAARSTAEADLATALRRAEEAEARAHRAETELREAAGRVDAAERRAETLAATHAEAEAAAAQRVQAAQAEAEAEAARRIAEARAEAEVRARDAEAAVELRVAQAAAEAESRVAARIAEAAAAAEAQAERVRTDAEARIAAAVAEADARAARVTAEVDARIRAAAEAAEARADAALVEARAAREGLAEAETVIANLSGAALRSAARALDHGEGSLAGALDEARQYVAHHGAGLATVLRLRALDALDGSVEGLARARDNAAVAAGLGAGLDPAEAEVIAVRAATHDAARRNPTLAQDAAKAEGAGLPRLAEALWLKRAEAGDGPAALARAAAAALWGGRWIEAAGLAAAAAERLAADGDMKAALAARLTAARARLFAGMPDALPLLEALARDATQTLGRADETAWEARRLHVRALFEAGEAEAAEQATASLSGGPVDPAVDPMLRAARARGLMVSGEAEAAAAVFDALARQSGEKSRGSLGDRLDAAEARLAAGMAQDQVLAALDRLAPAVRDAFGPRHPRAGQIALLRAQALAAEGESTAARAALDVAEAVFAPRFDPAHRWRVAAATLGEALAALVPDAVALPPAGGAPAEGATLAASAADPDGEPRPAEPEPEVPVPADPVPVEPEPAVPDRPEPEEPPVEPPAPAETPTEVPPSEPPPVERPGPWGAYSGSDAPRPAPDR